MTAADFDCQNDGWEPWVRDRVRAAGQLSDLATQAGKLLDRAGRLVAVEAADLSCADGAIGARDAADAAGKLRHAAVLLRDVERIAALWGLGAQALADTGTTLTFRPAATALEEDPHGTRAGQVRTVDGRTVDVGAAGGDVRLVAGPACIALSLDETDNLGELLPVAYDLAEQQQIAAEEAALEEVPDAG